MTHRESKPHGLIRPMIGVLSNDDDATLLWRAQVKRAKSVRMARIARLMKKPLRTLRLNELQDRLTKVVSPSARKSGKDYI